MRAHVYCCCYYVLVTIQILVVVVAVIECKTTSQIKIKCMSSGNTMNITRVLYAHIFFFLIRIFELWCEKYSKRRRKKTEKTHNFSSRFLMEYLIIACGNVFFTSFAYEIVFGCPFRTSFSCFAKNMQHEKITYE